VCLEQELAGRRQQAVVANAGLFDGWRSPVHRTTQLKRAGHLNIPSLGDGHLPMSNHLQAILMLESSSVHFPSAIRTARGSLLCSGGCGLNHDKDPGMTAVSTCRMPATLIARLEAEECAAMEWRANTTGSACQVTIKNELRALSSCYWCSG
jgi:hypothetical protein